MAVAYRIPEMIFVAVRLGIADLLVDGPKSSNDLAAATDANPEALYRLLRALASTGIFAEINERRFELTPLAETMCKDSTNSMYDFLMYHASPSVRLPWANLMHSVKTGEDAFTHVFQEDHWGYFSKNPEASGIFNRFMGSITVGVSATVVDAWDFAGSRTVVDVGGGTGELLAEIMKQYPQVNGMLQDLASPLEEAEGVMKREGVADRCEFVIGSFFESVVSGSDTYILKQILHDWNDEDSRSRLRNCRKAMEEGTKLLVIEVIVPLGNNPSISKMGDIHMLVVNPGGRERTEDEFRALLHEGGFNMVGVTPTQSRFNIIEAVAI